MKITLDTLPDDVAFLHQMIGDLSSKVLSLSAENDSLKVQLALLKAKRFGKSSEKLNQQIAELELRVEENECATGGDRQAEEPPAKEAANKPKRKPLPAHLPREHVTLNPDSTCPECGGEAFRKIADDISETLEYIPSSFTVIRHIRPRCACIHCEKIVQAEVPDKTIAKGLAGPGLLAHMMVQKYCNHLPFYRQSEIYEREGIELSRSTMAGWAGQCARLLEPLIIELKKSIFAGEHLHGDDTPIRVLAPGLGKTKTGRLWAYVRDGRPHGADVPPAVCYFYSPDRKGIRPLEHLKNFTGTLHADAYAGFDKLYEKDENGRAKINESACWAHTRRKFYEVTVAIPNANIAAEALVKIGELYKMEEKIRGRQPDERFAQRQTYSQEMVDEFFIWLRKCLTALPKKSETAKAITYALNLEEALRRFLDDGKIEIDNNAAERAMRAIALGRKNWLFAGSDKGGATAAALYSLIETAKLNAVNPQKYLTKIFTLIQNHNSQKLADLLPWNLKLV